MMILLSCTQAVSPKCYEHIPHKYYSVIKSILKLDLYVSKPK